MNVEAKVRQILLEIMDVKAEAVVPSARLVEDLGATSLDLVELLTAAENTFNIDLGDTDGTELTTVQEIISKIELMLGQKVAAS